MDAWYTVLGTPTGLRPSVFELAAQATLTDLLKPALRQTLAVRLYVCVPLSVCMCTPFGLVTASLPPSLPLSVCVG
jgi:hypothetical protein